MKRESFGFRKLKNMNKNDVPKMMVKVGKKNLALYYAQNHLVSSCILKWVSINRDRSYP